MVIITRYCVDCGKEKTAQKSRFYKDGVWIEDYRCHSCAGKHWWEINPDRRKNNKVTYACIDCGKERTLYPSDFKKPREEYRCYTCAQKNRRSERIVLKCSDCGRERKVRPSDAKHYKISEYRCYKCSRKHIRVGTVTYKCIDCGKERTDYKCNFDKPEENYRCFDCACKNKENVEKIRNTVLLLHKENEEYIKNFKSGMIKRMNDPKNKESMILRSENVSWIEQLTGELFWYGHHILRGPTRLYYCEKWNKDLKNRIDAAYDFKSILSGKTRFENHRGYALDRHHLYWQEKACCIWDEDAGGYYAWINNGSNKNPDWIKYYIKEDPNKFVLLTHEEHGIVRGNKKSGRDKIWWIKFLEDRVEQRTKEGKKCYLTKEEYEIYKVKHANIIKKYKK
jgi:hypothetical protein